MAGGIRHVLGREEEAVPLNGMIHFAGRRLLDKGYHAVSSAFEKVPNGRVAMQKPLATPSFDLVLSDLLMPELDGVGLYRELEKLDPSLVQRIIFVSGTTQVSAYARFLDEVGAPVLRKPFGIEALLRAEAEFLGRPSAPGTAS